MDKQSRVPLRNAGIELFTAVVFLLFASDLVECAAGEPSPVREAETPELLVAGHLVGKRGGDLVAAVRAEPKTFNAVFAVDTPSRTIIRRLMADLIHINRDSQRTEPALAKSWKISDEGRLYTLKLRRGVRFSDGHPFDAGDVLFTFKVHLDEKVNSPDRSQLIVGDKPIVVRKIDSHTIEFELSAPYAIGERLFDSISILPRHILEESYERGELVTAWTLATPPEQIVGLGPFRLKRYMAGERCELERNPYYWKIDREGVRLPYLDRLNFLFATSNAQVARFQAGELDVIDHLSVENYLVLERNKGEAVYQLKDLGPGLVYNFLFFNLNDLSHRELSEIEGKQSWFRDLSFRKAVSRAIDREGIVRLVFRNRAAPLWAHATPGNKLWVNRKIAGKSRSVKNAKRILSSAGYRWDSSGGLMDSEQRPVGFTIIASASNSQRIQMATMIQEDLREIGVRVNIVPLEHRSVVERVMQSLDYDACILALESGDTDPNPELPVLLSNGNLHLWNLGQERPATSWEAEIDRLMNRQIATLDYVERKKQYDRVQELMAENLPLIYLASQSVLVGSRNDVGNFRPVIYGHPTLWNADEIYRRGGGGNRGVER